MTDEINEDECFPMFSIEDEIMFLLHDVKYGLHDGMSSRDAADMLAEAIRLLNQIRRFSRSRYSKGVYNLGLSVSAAER